jgi:hypothetical protein
MPLYDADNLLEQLEFILAPLPPAERDLLKRLAQREMIETPVITLATQQMWVDAWEHPETKEKHPGGYQMLSWRVGHTSPQNPEAMIFAMLLVDVNTVHVYSFAAVKDETEKESVIWFKETLFKPSSTFGPLAGEALVLDWAKLLQDEDEYDDFMEKREAAIGTGVEAAAAGASAKPS